MDDLWHIRQRLFFTLGMERLRERFLELSSKETFAKNEIIFREGEPGNSCYYIESGLVRIFNTSLSGKESAFFLRREEELFGLSEIFDSVTRRASAQAMTAVRLYRMSGNAFAKLIEDEPILARRCITVLGSRVRILSDQINRLTTGNVENRLIYQLISIASDQLEDESAWRSPVRLPVKVSQEHLASLTGSTQPTICELLQQLQRLGLIAVESRQITIYDPMSLIAYADMKKTP